MVDITVSDFMKGRYNLMIYVGVDIAKLNHFASAVSSEGDILIEPFKFTNDNDGFQLLISKLESLDKDSIIIGLESTAHYGDNLVRYLVASNYKVCVLNPIKTSTMRKNNIRKTKTDKVDTYIICKTLMMQDSLRFVSFYDLDLMDLKALGRFRQKTIKQRTRLKIQLTSYVDEVFPELQYFFKSGLHQKSVYALLAEAPTPEVNHAIQNDRPRQDFIAFFDLLWQTFARQTLCVERNFSARDNSVDRNLFARAHDDYVADFDLIWIDSSLFAVADDHCKFRLNGRKFFDRFSRLVECNAFQNLSDRIKSDNHQRVHSFADAGRTDH